MRALILSNITDGKGLYRDAEVLKSLCESLGHKVVFRDFRDRPRRQVRVVADYGICCEVVPAEHQWGMAKKWIWIVNPEWARPEYISTSDRFFRIACKTEDARRCGPWVLRASVVGFECADVGGVGKKFSRNRFLHPAGGSIARGTAEIIKGWKLAMREHRSSGAELTIVDPPKMQEVQELIKTAPNLIALNRQPQARLRRLQRESPVHLIASEYEGWGHMFWEALSAGCTVIGTDGPWWLSAGESYVKIRSKRHGRRMSAKLLKVDPEHVAELISYQIESGHQSFNESARNAFERERDGFRAKMSKLIGECL